MRSSHRPRRYINPWLLATLKPALRYSDFRDAYILRGIGNHVGPVIRPERRRKQVEFPGRDRRTTLSLTRW